MLICEEKSEYPRLKDFINLESFQSFIYEFLKTRGNRYGWSHEELIEVLQDMKYFEWKYFKNGTKRTCTYAFTNREIPSIKGLTVALTDINMLIRKYKNHKPIFFLNDKWNFNYGQTLQD